MQNFKGIQETNAALEAQVKAMEADVQGMVAPMATAMTELVEEEEACPDRVFMGYRCECCDEMIPPDAYVDEEDDVECNYCGDYTSIHDEECKVYE